MVADFDETRAREWFAALDYGFAHSTVVLLGCTDADGNLFVVDEHAERLWLPQRHGDAVRAMVGRHRMGDRALELGDLRRIPSPSERGERDTRPLYQSAILDKPHAGP